MNLMQRGLRTFFVIIGVFIALLIAAWGVGTVMAKRATARAMAEEWPLGLGPASSVPSRFPKSDANAAAKQMNDLTMKIGLRLEPRSGKKPVTETPAEKEYDDVRNPLGTFQSAETEKADDFVDAPPEKVVAFLNAHAADIDAIRSELLRGVRMEWPVDLQKLFDAPIPNLLGHMQLTKLFATSALIKARNHDASGWDDLHAVWNLDENLRRRPDLISQLIALAGARITNAVARKLPAPEPAWRTEMKNFDFRRSLMSAQQAEAWVTVEVLDRAPMPMEEENRSGWWRPFMVVMRPYMAIGGADMMRHHREAAMEIAAFRKCAFDGEKFNNQVQASLASWNYFGRIAMPSIGTMYQRQIHLVPEMEATSNLLRLKQDRAASAAHEWPESLSDRSSRCADGTWEYERHPDGTAALRFSKKLPALKTAPQPLEFSLAK
jgi:hypothetical protein